MFFYYFADPGAHFGGPGAHPGGPGAHFEISGIDAISGGAPARITVPISRHFLTNFEVFAVLFFYVFSSACFFDFL